MFYDRYCELCQQKGVSPSRAAIEMGINKGTVSVWKNKGTHPQAAQLQKIADYFDVSVDYLLGMERDIFDGQGLVNGKNIYTAPAIAVSKDDLDLNQKETPLRAKSRTGEKKNVVRTIGRDGSYEERYLTDEQLEALKAVIRQMPKVEDDF